MKEMIIKCVIAALILGIQVWAGDVRAETQPLLTEVEIMQFLCLPQVKLSGDAADFHFYTTHPGPGKFSLLLFGKTKEGVTETDIGVITAKVKKEDDTWVDVTTNCQYQDGGYFMCAATFDSNNRPRKARLITELGCGYSPLVDLTIGTESDNDGDGVPNAQDLCLSTPFGLYVDTNGCVPVPDDTPSTPSGGGSTSSEDDVIEEEEAELNQGAPSPPQFTPPTGGFDESAGCNAVPGVPLNPSAYLIISIGLAILSWRRSR